MSGPVVPASHGTFAKPAGLRAEFIPEDFDKLVDAQGTRVRITPALLCPNRTSKFDTNHALDCPLCSGEGRVDLEDQCFEDWAVIQSIKLEKQFLVQGIFDMKDAQITTRQAVRLYYFYKIEVLDFASVYNEEVVRSAQGDFDKIRYNTAASCDTPHFCIDKNGVRYIKDVDYRFDGDKRIRWNTLSRPPVESLFSITYPILPTFRVLEILHENRYYYSGYKSPVKVPVNLPQQALIRWDYMAKGSGFNVLRENNG